MGFVRTPTFGGSSTGPAEATTFLKLGVIAVTFLFDENRRNPDLLAALPVKNLGFRMYVLTSNWPDLDDLLLSHPDQNVVQEYDKVKRSILHNLLVLSNPNNQINSIFLFGLLVVGVCGVLLLPNYFLIGVCLASTAVCCAAILLLTDCFFLSEKKKYLLQSQLGLFECRRESRSRHPENNQNTLTDTDHQSLLI